MAETEFKKIAKDSDCIKRSELPSLFSAIKPQNKYHVAQGQFMEEKINKILESDKYDFYGDEIHEAFLIEFVEQVFKDVSSEWFKDYERNKALVEEQ